MVSTSQRQPAKAIFAATLALLTLPSCGASDSIVPAAADTIAQSKSEAEFDPENFTTVGKPTKTIETPWGPREVYDPTQDPEIRRLYTEWRKTKNPFWNTPAKLQMEEAKILADQTQRLDYARHQCTRQIMYQTCYELEANFKEPCLDQNLHSSKTSECESKNLVGKFSIAPSCSAHHRFGIWLQEYNAPTLDEALDIAFDINCAVWRGEQGGD